MAAVATIAAVLWILLKPTEERRVARVFSGISEIMHKRSGEGMLASAAKSESVCGYCEDPVYITVTEAGIGEIAMEKQEIRRRVVVMRSYFTEMDLIFDEVNVVLSSGDQASVSADVTLRGTGAEDGTPNSETREMNAVMKKDGKTGEWLIHSLVIEPIIEK